MDRFHHRVERILIAGCEHPAGERARALRVKGVEGHVDDSARTHFAASGGLHRLADAGGDGLGQMRRQRLLQPGRRSEMVEKIGMGTIDPARHGLQRHGLRSRLDQQRARGLHGGAAALVGAKACAFY